MNKKQFLTLEATLVVIVVLLCVQLFSNSQLMKKNSSLKETVNTTDQLEKEMETVNTANQIKEETEPVEIAADTTSEEDKTEEVSEDDATTIKDEEKIFSRFPGATSLAAIADQIKPLNGDTYKQRQNNFEEIDIFVQEEVVINPSSDNFPQKTVDISIYNENSIITILNEKREEDEEQFLMPYNLYRKNEEIILEGVDLNTRKYYEYHFQNGNWYVYGGENVDVPNEEKDYIFLTFDNGTYTLKGTKLTFWNFFNEEVTGEIPEPAEPQNMIFCQNSHGYTVANESYFGLPYIDKNNNIINLLITAESENWDSSHSNIFITDIDYKIVASNVKKIIEPDGYDLKRIVYQNESGDYKLAIISDEGNLQKVIDLNEETVSKVQFRTWGWASSGKSWLSALYVTYDVEGYGTVFHLLYDLKNSIIWNETTNHLKSLIKGEFSASEFKERYKKVIQEIQKFE